MPQFAIVVAHAADDKVAGTHSFTTGFVPLKRVALVPRRDEDALAHAFWLIRQDRRDEADVLIEEFCSRKR